MCQILTIKTIKTIDTIDYILNILISMLVLKKTVLIKWNDLSIATINTIDYYGLTQGPVIWLEN